MNIPARRSRLVRAISLVWALGAPLVSSHAQPADAPVTELDPVLIIATRTPQSPAKIGSTVDFISGDDLLRRQLGSLRQALGGDSVPLFASGAPGAATSLFLRGANSNQTLFLVDGLRVNDPNADYTNLLGGLCVSGCDNLEVSHGPQSTLYGGEAIGGVVSLRTSRGEGEPSGRVAVEGGSFGTIQAAASAQGEKGPWAYAASAAGGHTDNQRANNQFDSGSYAARVDRKVNSAFAVGATIRGFSGSYGSPGDRFTNDPDNHESEQNNFGTVFADYAPSKVWRTHLILGGQDRRYVLESPAPSGVVSETVIKNRRAVLDWQNTVMPVETHRVTAGLTAEENSTRNTGFGNIDKKQSLLAFFAQDEWTPVKTVFLTAGLRNDDFDTFGRATTGRGTAAWQVVPQVWKLRASYGTAFRSPSFLDLYGRSAFYVGNPNLRAESARGWDGGMDFYFPKHAGSLSVTWFETEFHDLIVNDFTVFPSTVTNVGHARTSGVEFSAKAILPADFQASVSYTYLEAKNLTTGARLLRRPRHAGNLDVYRNFRGGFSAGVGVQVIAQREDINARTFATIDGEDYTVVRLYMAWKATDRLTFKARVENLLNEKYEEVNGYPALGSAIFAGAEWKF